jgi:DNA-binding NarL/FixJ family response regulator
MPPTAISVVVVEDDPGFLAAFTHAIEGAEGLHLAGTAATVSQGRALLERADPDVLLVDLGLPDGNGIELIRACRKAHPRCDVMVTTVFGDEAHVIESIEAGATGYLLKDSSSGEIAEQIRMLHGGGSPISPVIARRLLTRFVPPTASRPGTDLSARELEVLNLITRGFTFDEISRLLSVSSHTVSTYVKRIYAKLEVGSKTEAVYEARKLGLVRD